MKWWWIDTENINLHRHFVDVLMHNLMPALCGHVGGLNFAFASSVAF